MINPYLMVFGVAVGVQALGAYRFSRESDKGFYTYVVGVALFVAPFVGKLLGVL